MLFELPDNTECMLTTFVGRTQKSGPEDVPAVSFRLKMSSVSNILLDRFSKTIRHTVYRAVEGQEQLPGMEDTTPILQSKDLTQWTPDTCLEGWRVIVARGRGDDTALQMGSCKIDDFRFDFHDGGHMDVDFRIGTADVDEAGAGMLWGRQKRKVFVMIQAPEVPAASTTTIDGSKGHPGLADSQAAEAERQAGDLFAQQHGGDDGGGAAEPGDQQHAGDFGQPDDDSAGPGAGSSDDAPFGQTQTGDNWPFPQGDGTGSGQGGTDSEGGETDAAGDAAEFEAGAAAAIEKATGGRRGKRTRASVQ